MDKFIREMDEFLKAYQNETDFSGTLRITYKDEIIYENYIGMADFEKGKSFNKDSVFNFYSITKPFCAIGLMLLKDKGLVDIDKHPSFYLPEAKGFNEKLKIKHLLNHTSGLPDFEQDKEFALRYVSGKNYEIREQLKLLTGFQEHFSPGEGSMYANINYIVCALIIENVSKKPFYEYMKEKVFDPLGLKTAAFDTETLKNENRVQGYDKINGIKTPVESAKNWIYGAGDMVGTLNDVYALCKAVKNKLLLKAKTWQEVLTPSALNNMGYGCTVSLWKDKLHVRHNGGHTGFRTLHIYLPEYDFDIIVLSNSGFMDGRMAVANKAHDLFFGARKCTEAEFKMDSGYIK